jgi:16S rRNA (adenine1518-N6/adenine1519-N6)-dimethyltransferase
MKSFDKRKAFGQHFLTDITVINGIVDETIHAISRNEGHSLLEIGPGKGAITRPLLAKLPIDKKFYVAERDKLLIEFWKPESRITQLLAGDFLDQNEESLHALGKIVVVSNLPYSAGTAIVVRLCEMSAQIPEMILMFQAEVAKRLYAEPSTPDRGSLSLYIQNEWDVKRLLVVKPEAFNPPPKVMSEVVTLKRREVPHVALPDFKARKKWNELLKTAFLHRRKMLRVNLGKSRWKDALEKSGVDPTLRAEALEWKDWVALWQNSF